MKEYIVENLESENIAILHFTELPSTNDFAKAERKNGRDLIVLADRQTGGRGTKGRSFSSECGGIYLSKLTFHKSLAAKRAFEIMAGAATAVCETLSAYGLQPCIKWPNDIHVGGKKIGGILIENSFSGSMVVSSVVGIGLNVCNELPSELCSIATTMAAQGSIADLDAVTKRLIETLCRPCDMERYQFYLGYMGREAELIIGDERIPATLLFVDGEGNLHAKTARGEEVFSAAEVSLRGL